jgi:hypothetical protein
MAAGRKEYKSNDIKHQPSSHHSDEEYESDEDPATPVVSEKKPGPVIPQVKSAFTPPKSMELDSKLALPPPPATQPPAAVPTTSHAAKPPETPFGTNLTFFNHQKHFVNGNPAVSKHAKHVLQQDFGTHTKDHKTDEVMTHVYDAQGNLVAQRHFMVIETILRRPGK